MTKSKDPGDFDPTSGLKVVGDHTGHKELPQEDSLFLWDNMNSNKEYLAQAVCKCHKLPIEFYAACTEDGKKSKAIKNQGYHI